MANDWNIWLEKVAKNLVMGGVSMGVIFFTQIESQCPGATLTIGGATIAVKVVLDALANAAKHREK